jgi:hypothetical protein
MSRIKRNIKQVRATDNPNIGVVHSSAVGGMRQMRCGSCPGMMVPGRHHNGMQVFKCTGCGALATSRPM